MGRSARSAGTNRALQNVMGDHHQNSIYYIYDYQRIENNIFKKYNEYKSAVWECFR